MRIWVPGCATGEEAYSLAILLREHMDNFGTPQVQIFASDIDEIAIDTARLDGFRRPCWRAYTGTAVAVLFTEGPDGYLVRQEMRELCTFSAHSLIRDPPFSRIDLISCRNLLIYMDSDLQDRVIPIFHYALDPERYPRPGLLGNDRPTRAAVPAAGPIANGNLSGRRFQARFQAFIILLPPRRGEARRAMANRPDPKAHWSKAVARQPARAGTLCLALRGGERRGRSRAFFPPYRTVSWNPRLVRPAPICLTWPARLGPGTSTALRRCIETRRPVEQFRSVLKGGW